MSDRPELPALILALKELSWSDVKQMAIHLDGCVDLTLLTNIEGGYPIEECLMYAMKAWLEKDCEASWAKVVAALRAVSKNALAVRVETEYVTADNSILRPNHSELRSSPPGVSPQLSNEVHAALATPSLVHVEPQPTLELASLCHSQPENMATPSSMALSQVTFSSTESLVPTVDCSATDGSAGGSESGGARVQALTGEAAQLQEQFVTVLAHTKIYFMEKETESQKFLRKFQITVTTLPLSKKYQHLHFLKREKDAIMNAENVSEVFDILDPYWNYVDYDFLKYIIKEFGTRELREEIRTYITELEKFEKKTSVQDYNLATLNQRNVPAYFRRVTVTQLKDPARCSLFEVRQFKNDIVNQSTLNGYAVFLESVSCSSVEITLAFPPEAYKELSVVFDVQFMKTHKIVSKVFSDRESSEETTCPPSPTLTLSQRSKRRASLCMPSDVPSASKVPYHSGTPAPDSAVDKDKLWKTNSSGAALPENTTSYVSSIPSSQGNQEACSQSSLSATREGGFHSQCRSYSEPVPRMLLSEQKNRTTTVSQMVQESQYIYQSSLLPALSRDSSGYSLSSGYSSVSIHSASPCGSPEPKANKLSRRSHRHPSVMSAPTSTTHLQERTDAFRKLICDISEKLLEIEVLQIDYLCNVPPTATGMKKTGLDVLIALEKLGKFSSWKTEPLIKLLEDVMRFDVANYVREQYQTKYPDIGEKRDESMDRL